MSLKNMFILLKHYILFPCDQKHNKTHIYKNNTFIQYHTNLQIILQNFKAIRYIFF